MSNFTPGRAYREGFRWALPTVVLGCVAVLVVAAIVLVGWQVGWWFSNQNVNRQAQQTQNGYSNQTTLHQQVTQNIATITSLTSQIDGTANAQQAADLKAQRAAVAGTACEDASEVSSADPLPASQRQWASANCSDGALSPNSSLYEGGN
jgi:hypothetical protein